MSGSAKKTTITRGKTTTTRQASHLSSESSALTPQNTVLSAKDECINTGNMSKEQCDYIINLVSQQIIISEKRISDKISNEIKELQETIKIINIKVNKLETEHLNNKKTIDTLNSEVRELKKNIVDVCKQSTVTQTELINIKKSQNFIENRTVANDAILFGVPFYDDEKLESCFNFLCNSLSIKTPTINSIYRARGRTESKDTPIHIKFLTPFDRNFVLKSIAQFRKTNNREMCLQDIHIDSPNALFMREALTKNNLMIFQRAMALRKQKLLSTVYTARGIVYAKRLLNENAVPINFIEDLNRVACSAD